MANTFDISGKWTLSRTLSDDPEEMMLLQGFNYFLRKASRLGSMTIIFNHDQNGDPPTLSLTVLPPGGFAKESRVRKLNGEKESDYHFLFGTNDVLWDKKTIKDEMDPYFLDEEWIGEDLLLEDIYSGDGKFSNHGIWGLVDIGGEKRLVKRVVLIRNEDGKRALARQVFEYAPLD